MRIVIDTDPGVDDMVAILAALAEPGFDIAGITTVGGNVSLAATTRNALRILAMAARGDVPVYMGAESALDASARHVHGEDGLGGCDWPEAPFGAKPSAAVSFLGGFRSRYTLACLGPLTNIAGLLRERPDAAASIDRIVLMGGGFGTHSFSTPSRVVHSQGNVVPDAEFNIHTDPEAARAVFSSGIPVTVIPLDVSHQTLVSRERLDGLEGRVGRAVAPVLDRYGEYSRARWEHHSGPLHDPNVLAHLADGGLHEGQRGEVAVSAGGKTTLVESADGLHTVMTRVEANRYLDWVWQRLARL